MPNYFTLIRVGGNQTKEVEKSLKTLQKKPSPDVTVIGTWTSFGQYDAAVYFAAETESEGMQFVANQIRGMPGVLSTETLSVIPQATFTPVGQ